MEKGKRLEVYLQRVLDAINKINLHTKGDILNFETNPTVIDASILQLIHIGETMNKVKKTFPTLQLEGVELSRIIGFRHIAAHDYLGLNISVIKKIIFDHLPILKKSIQNYLKLK